MLDREKNICSVLIIHQLSSHTTLVQLYEQLISRNELRREIKDFQIASEINLEFSPTVWMSYFDNTVTEDDSDLAAHWCTAVVRDNVRTRPNAVEKAIMCARRIHLLRTWKKVFGNCLIFSLVVELLYLR